VLLKDEKSKVGVKIEVIKAVGENEVPLDFFQIYTPGHRKTIAIEPQTSTGNAFFVNFPKVVYALEGGKKASGSFAISIVNLEATSDEL